MRKRSSSFSELSIEEIVDIEKVRYHRKGYGLIFASIIVTSWFILLPLIFPYFWPTNIEHLGKFMFIAGMVIHEGFFILINLSFFIIYKLEWDFFERYKTHDHPWSWKANPEKWNIQIQRTFCFLALNHLIFMPLLLLPYYIFNHCPFSLEYEKLPSCVEIIIQTIFFMLIEDFSFYWCHRTLHNKRIYPYIHKIHHEYINVVSISSEFSHPLEFIIGNVLTTNLGPLMLGKRVHFTTFAMWIIMRIGETTDGHSGYEFSWSPYRLLPFSGSSEFHNFHHLNIKGNYSSFFTYWDRLLGTVNPSFEKYVQKKQQLYYKQTKEKKMK